MPQLIDHGREKRRHTETEVITTFCRRCNARNREMLNQNYGRAEGHNDCARSAPATVCGPLGVVGKSSLEGIAGGDREQAHVMEKVRNGFEVRRPTLDCGRASLQTIVDGVVELVMIRIVTEISRFVIGSGSMGSGVLHVWIDHSQLAVIDHVNGQSAAQTQRAGREDRQTECESYDSTRHRTG
jgi:hypothetical protein